MTDIYYDFRSILVDSDDVNLLSYLFFRKIDDLFKRKKIYDASIINIIGLEFWGAVFVPLLSLLNNQNNIGKYNPIILRKEKQHGIDKRIYEKKSIQKEFPKILIDDVLTTGGNLKEAIEYLLLNEVEINAIIVLLNRGVIEEIESIPVESIFQI